MRVAVVTVGDELLAGDVTNTNAAWLADRLTDRGASVERVVTVGDEIGEIAAVVGAAAERWDAVVVTGGLGPTHDDVTMAGIAAAFDRELIEHPDAVAALADEGYAREDLAAGTTQLPAGARALANHEGVAPGAVVESVYVLPGVPTEMRAMFDRVASAFDGEPRHVAFVETDEPESALLDRLADVRDQFDITVGSYPGDGVRIKLQSADRETVEAAAEWLRERVDAPE